MTKEDIIKLWCEILNKEDIDTEKTYFENGGNSLNVVKMLKKLEKDYNINLDVMGFFQNATIEFILGENKND